MVIKKGGRGGGFFLYKIIFFLSKVFTIMLKIRRFVMRRNIYYKKTFHIEIIQRFSLKQLTII